MHVYYRLGCSYYLIKLNACSLTEIKLKVRRVR